jgi:hypothetical protein
MQCQADTQCETQCSRNCTNNSEFCWQHGNDIKEEIPDLLLKKFPNSKYKIEIHHHKTLGTIYFIEAYDGPARDDFGSYYDANAKILFSKSGMIPNYRKSSESIKMEKEWYYNLE